MMYVYVRLQLNLEVEEVDFVRERMRGWKETLYTPVILDLNFIEPEGMGSVSQVSEGAAKFLLVTKITSKRPLNCCCGESGIALTTAFSINSSP